MGFINGIQFQYPRKCQKHKSMLSKSTQRRLSKEPPFKQDTSSAMPDHLTVHLLVNMGSGRSRVLCTFLLCSTALIVWRIIYCNIKRLQCNPLYITLLIRHAINAVIHRPQIPPPPTPCAPPPLPRAGPGTRAPNHMGWVGGGIWGLWITALIACRINNTIKMNTQYLHLWTKIRQSFPEFRHFANFIVCHEVRDSG